MDGALAFRSGAAYADEQRHGGIELQAMIIICLLPSAHHHDEVAYGPRVRSLRLWRKSLDSLGLGTQVTASLESELILSCLPSTKRRIRGRMDGGVGHRAAWADKAPNVQARKVRSTMPKFSAGPLRVPHTFPHPPSGGSRLVDATAHLLLLLLTTHIRHGTEHDGRDALREWIGQTQAREASSTCKLQSTPVCCTHSLPYAGPTRSSGPATRPSPAEWEAVEKDG